MSKKVKALVVVDMQNDFITGALANPAAEDIIEKVAARVRQAREEGIEVFWTQDAHRGDYLDTQEGRNLPVEHCIAGTKGWEIVPELDVLVGKYDKLYEKNTFGSIVLAEDLARYYKDDPDAVIEFCGVCTDICVISNVMLAKAHLPENTVRVDAELVAGITPETHKAALDAMKMCQVEIVGE